jgi:hypothetical protein
MQQQEESEKNLDAYFEMARKEPPIVSVEEVGRLISSVPTISSNKSIWKIYKYWILASAIIIVNICAFLLYPRKNKTIVPSINEAAQVTNDILVNQPLNKSKDSARSNLTEKETNLSLENTVKKEKDIKQETKKERFYFQGNAKVHFEEDGKQIEMIVDENFMQLKIDGKTIEQEAYDQYSDIIEKGLQMKKSSDELSTKNESNISSEKKRHKQTMNELISQLGKDSLVDIESHFEFRLTGTKLYIDEIEQSDALFNQYKNIYESVSGNKLNKKSNIKIKH